MKLIYILSFLLVSSICLSQVENGCIAIDFESLPGQQPQEGLTIRDQYKASFGLSFSLEGGGFPVLAEVGGATTAFGSSAGSDTPLPGNNMGRFFLTDDGRLSGLTAPPIILEFETPIDSFSGCIVDIDLSEQFIIHALDSSNQIILADTISDGDPGTGDGLLTCWGFNLPGCEGRIHSIRFAGTRTQSGSFGLGIDSLSFCYSGLNIKPDLKDATCTELGQIQITSTTNEVYGYSLDGITYDEDGFFDNLDPGIYTIFVIDSDGCETSVDIIIDPPPERDLISESIPTSCAEDNGQLSFFLDPDITAMYSLDGGLTYQSENVYDNMPPGTYNITVRDSLDCFYTEDNIVIAPSVIPSIQDATTSIDSCNDARGSILIEGTNGMGVTDPLQYSINNSDYNSDNLFLDLSTGVYTIYVRDSQGCTVDDTVFIDSTPEVIVRSIEVTSPDCFTDNAVIEVEAQGGSGILQYEINGSPQIDSIINNLPYGSYELIITDELGCTYTETVIIEAPTCPIYIPNVITPNNDDSEDIFQVFTNSDYEVGIIRYLIYDRWGELVFVSEAYSIHTEEITYWWDGYFNGKPAEPGVYVYLIEVRHPNDSTELYSGDVTLLR